MKRANTWEASIAVISQDGANYTFSNSNSALSVESSSGWGFSLGYTPSNHLLLNWEFATTSPRYNVMAPDGVAFLKKQIFMKISLMQRGISLMVHLHPMLRRVWAGQR
jgi:hypothetical protein